MQVSGESERSHNHLHRALHLLVHGLFEKVRVEQDTHYRPDFVAGIDERIGQKLNGPRVSRRFDRPRRHLWFVSYEEVVEVPGDEARTLWLPENDVYYIVSVEVAGVSKKGLPAEIVFFGAELEAP